MNETKKKNVPARSMAIWPSHPASEANALINMIERVARDASVDIDKLERLLAMQERVTAGRKRTAYMAALADLQGELPAIVKRGRIDIGRGKPQAYAMLEDVIEVLRAPMHRHGFGFQFHTAHPQPGQLAVTTILSHRDGHEDETTIVLPYDTTGSKNAVQSLGSSMSYGRRYGIMAMLNLATTGEDDDGKAGGVKDVVPDEQALDLQNRMDHAGLATRRFCERFGIDKVGDLPAAKLQEALDAIAGFAERATKP